MKTYIFLTVFLLNASLVQAQNKAWQNVFGAIDRIDLEYLKKLDAARTFKSDENKIIVSVDDGKYFTSHRSGKKHDKVIFSINGQRLYAAAKINYEKNKIIGYGRGNKISNIEVVPHSDVRYLENNQLYCSLADMDGNEPYKVKFDATIYHKDGSIMYGRKQENHSNYTIVEGYEGKEKPIFRRFLYHANSRFSKNEIAKVLSPWIFDATASSKAHGEIINRTTKGLYKGTPHLGIFTSQNQEQYSGFFGPVASMPQGSVLFRQSGNNYEWVLVVGGNVEKTLVAKASDMPNLSLLQQQLSVGAHMGDLIYKIGSQSANFPFPELLGKYTTRPVNGYGIRYETTASPTPAKELLFEVGLFKNGKLEGLGYRLTGMTNFWGSSPTSALVFNLYAQAGVFVNGKLVDGREFSPGMFYGKKDVDPYRNIWAKSPIDGFNYLQIDNSPIDTLQFYEKIPQSEVRHNQNAKVFIEKLNRWVSVLGVDNEQQLIVKGDERNMVLNNAMGNVYYQSEFSRPVKIGCPKTKIVKKYKTVKEDVNLKDSQGRTLITNIDRSGYLKPIKIYTSTREVFEGYETVTCNICNGQGYYNSSTKEKVMYRLDLASANLYDKVSSALKRASVTENTNTEISLFGTMEHLKFEAENYLNLFNNDATRTYDHLNAYNKRLQYEWIQSAKNAGEIYTAFADLCYLIYQKNPNASYYFLTSIHKNSFNESLKIITKKYPEAMGYLRKMAKDVMAKSRTN